MTGTVFDIQRYSIHDGPGIRTLIFMKGCPLRCAWCSNPEGQEAEPELRFIAARCVGRSECSMPCLANCPVGAIEVSAAGRPRTNRDLCRGCGRCTVSCAFGARQLSGRPMTTDEVLSEILKDEDFVRDSGGGVTLGGGEPLAQPDFARELLKGCKAHHLHTVVETCGHASWDELSSLMETTDLVYYDIKHPDSVRHEQMTGFPNSLIMANAERLLSKWPGRVVVRVPVVPGWNDSPETIGDIAAFVLAAGGRSIELMPYHRLGVAKYAQLDRRCPLPDLQPCMEEHIRALRDTLGAVGMCPL